MHSMRMKGIWPSKKTAERHVPSNDPRTHFGLPHAYSLTRIVHRRLAQILFILIGYLHAIAVVPWKLQRLLLSFHKIPLPLIARPIKTFGGGGGGSQWVKGVHKTIFSYSHSDIFVILWATVVKLA